MNTRHLVPDTASRGRRTRGSALALVILIALVLTVIGIGLAYMTSIEDTVSGNDQRQKAGFYASEVGLRQAEGLLTSGVLSNTVTVSALFTNVPPAPGPGGAPSTFVPPGGGYTANLLVLNNTPYRDVQVTMPAGSRDIATYSLYVRNDREDVQGTATVDQNKILNIISVGVVRLVDPSDPTKLIAGTTTITRILEEQITAIAAGSEGGLMKNSNAGSTGSLSN